jgi:hypothetical protein
MVALVFKFFLPIIGGYYVTKWCLSTFGNYMRAKLEKANFGKHPHKYSRDENIIEICSNCGEVKTQQHSC